MASRDVMELEMLKVFDDYEHLFKRLKIYRMDMLRWIFKFENQKDLCKPHRNMMNKILPTLKTTNTIWHAHTSEAWQSIIAMNPRESDVRKLNDSLFLTKQTWFRRPKAKRRY